MAAVRVAAGAPIGPDPTPPAARPGPLWFAHESTPRLWWQRLREHLTPRSVYFQGALRLAAALAVARLLAGVLDLSHGFWVLLTILTLLRASAAETRSLLWPALVGTLVGSVLAAALLVADIPPTVFAVFLPLVMLVGFAAGPLLGLGWGQALFTVVIALVFAQVSPVDWHPRRGPRARRRRRRRHRVGHRAARLAARRLRRAAPRCRGLPGRRRPGGPRDRRRPGPRCPPRHRAARGT